MDKQTINTYNKIAKEYDLETTDFWERFPVTIFDQFIKSVRGKRILDVGSGPGRDGLLLKNLGLDVICVDASESMVEMCVNRGLNAVVADFMKLPFKNDEFDGVWSYTALLHIRKNQIEEALKEIYRVLKPAGTFGLGLIEGDIEEYKLSSGIDKPRWFAYYNKQEIEALLNTVGFDVLYFEAFKPGSKNYLNFISVKK